MSEDENKETESTENESTEAEPSEEVASNETEESAEHAEEEVGSDEADDEASDDSDADDGDSEGGGSDDAGAEDAGAADADSDDSEEAAAEAKQAVKAQAAAAAAAAVAKRKKTGRKKKKSNKSTAGQRLARAKDVKAAKKAAERQIDEQEDVEEFVAEQAEAAATFLEKHQKSIVGGMVAIAACAALLWGYQKYNEGNASESSAALWDAVQTANALIVEEDDVSELEEELERYETVEARADQALEEFREVRTRFPGSVAAAYAALGEGNALYDKGDYDGAREAYEAAMAEGGNRGDIAVRALEGIAFTHEAQDAWDSAGENYSRLADVEASSASALSGLHLARVALHGGDEEDAKEHLRTVLEALREEDAPDLPYVRDQAELRLMAIDSSLVQRSPELNMPGGGDLSPEQMERIRQMLQQQQQQTP